MKKFLCRLLLLLLVFAAGVAGTAFLLNSETTDDRSDMNNPVLPEVMIDVGGIYANRMYGYAQEMQADFTRDSVTPLDTSKELKFVINGYEGVGEPEDQESGRRGRVSYCVCDGEQQSQGESGIFYADHIGNIQRDCLLLYTCSIQVRTECGSVCEIC